MIRSIALFSIAFSLCLIAAVAKAELPELRTGAAPATLSLSSPAGWDHLPGLSETVAQSASEADFFGPDETFESGAMAYGRANRGALYLTWIDSLRTQPSAESSIRTAFDELHHAPYLASPEPGSTQEVTYRERMFDGVAEMRFEWAHMSNGTVNVLRALGWKDAEARVHVAVAECVLQSEGIGESRPLCDTALDSLALTDKAAHETLAALPEPTAIGDMKPEEFSVPKLKTSETLPSDSLGAAPAQMGEVLYQGRPKPKSENNNRTIIAIGALLLAVAFYLTTRSAPTDSSEEEDENSDPPNNIATEAGGESNEGDASESANDTEEQA